MFSDHFIYLITKQFSGTITPLEEAELTLLLQQPGHLQKYERLQKFWQQKKEGAIPDTEAALNKVLQRINEEEPKPAPKQKASIKVKAFAVCFGAVLVIAGIFLVRNNLTTEKSESFTAKPNSADVVEKQNLKGTRSVITLADGSKVWLNADSRLKYPIAFSATTREVELIGEAFFDVTKNPQKPFIIHLENGTVKVLGTSFNIKAYPGEEAVETSVATGRVAFIPKQNSKEKGADTTFLTRNYKAIYTVETGAVRTVSTRSTEDKAWTEGKLIFHSASMEVIATALERYFGKQVSINDEEIRSYHLTGSFENNSAEEILYYLSKTKPFTYKITETQIIISLVR